MKTTISPDAPRAARRSREYFRRATLALAASTVLAVAQEPRPSDRPTPRGDRSAAARPAGRQRYSIEQATSDRAQLHTIAFDGFAFLTGDLRADTFLPPGKVSDFFGFQYLRDIDTGELGHNTSFLTRIANNVLQILDDNQKAQLATLGAAQAPQMRELALKRLPLIQAFRQNLEGRLPDGRVALDRAAVRTYCAGFFELSAQLAYERAEVCGRIARSLTDAQKAQFAQLKFGDSRTWPDVPEGFDRRRVPHDVHVAVMTYASEFFSWYAGSIEADTYFCPEGHGTYFGAFYVKDAPAIHQPNYSISTALTGDGGEAFLNALDADQRAEIASLVELQRDDLQGIVQTRRAIAAELRRFLAGETADREKVRTLGRHYGELDGDLSFLYATHFAAVNRTLTAEQRSALARLRTPDPRPGRGVFVYAEPLESPRIAGAELLFAAATK
jgi:Spy/CpxP family protein refolding chaperone